VTDTAVAGGPNATDIMAEVLPKGAPRWLFTLTILVGSFLLFLVQPMVARMALPRLGGAPAVWNSAMLVYQALLLGGYAWAHWIGRFSVKRQWMLHGGLLLVAALWLPVGLANMAAPSDNDVFLFVPLLLVASVGPLLFAVSAQAPLMQRWFADSAPGANPYSLYAASNLGSFGGLIAYPLLVEPNMPLLTQSWGWSVLYLVLVALVITCGWVAVRAVATPAAGQPALSMAKAETPPAGETVGRPTWGRIGLWIALSAVPSGLMLSTTTHLTTDIMAMPLMWAIPLGLYLLSFSIAFSEKKTLSDIFTLLAPPMLLLSGGLTMMSSGTGGMLIALSSLQMLFVVAVALHARLYRLRPENEHLTLFYLVMAVGGVVGGIFCALIAPLIFDWVYEHPLLVIAAAMLVPMVPLLPWADAMKLTPDKRRGLSLLFTFLAVVIGTWLTRAWSGWFDTREIAAIGALTAIGILTIGWRLPFIAALLALMLGIGGVGTLELSASPDRTRSYFGVYTIREHAERGTRTLSHGTTLHGTQLTTRGLERTVTSYYGPTSGVGLAFDRANTLYGNDAAIGVVGLGTGTLACYRRPGQQWQFFEIDPAMVQVSRDSGRFGFMPGCAAGVPVRIGDARLKLQEVDEASLDLLAIDAFSSDAIPLHLLTREAFAVYDRAIQDDGIVLVHISNRFINLEPVLAALTREGRGWHAMLRYDEPDQRDMALARTGSIWVAMARSEAPLTALAQLTNGLPGGRGSWQELDRTTQSRLWTDDYASVMPLLVWPGF
jgi:hypothetical protein